MKKTATLLVTALLATSLWAEKSSDLHRAKLASDMRGMLDAMVSIQRAGFYNDVEGMKRSVARIKDGLVSLRSTDAASYLPHDQEYAHKFANKRADSIAMYADDLVESLDAGDMDEALNDYNLMMKECTSCHLRIRQPYWKKKKEQMMNMKAN